MTRTLVAVALAAGLACSVGGGAAFGQNLGARDSASPSANAKIARALTKARSQEAQSGKGGLNRDTVNAGCGPVQLGDPAASKNKRTKHDQQTVIVPNVTVICR